MLALANGEASEVRGCVHHVVPAELAGHHGQPCVAHGGNQPRAGVADGGRTGIADVGDALTAHQALDDADSGFKLIVFMHCEQGFFNAVLAQ